MATETSPKLNVTHLVKLLRPMLMGTVKKISPTVYTIDGKCQIELNYYCQYVPGEGREDKDAKAKECYPSSITVSVLLEGLGKENILRKNPNISDVFRTRVFQKRDSTGDFKLESVATAVTKCIASYDKYVSWAKALDEADELKEKRKKDEIAEVTKLLKPFAKFNHNWRQWTTSNQAVQISYRQSDKDSAKFSFQVEISSLTRDQLLTVMDAVKALEFSKELLAEDE